jgi:hypothetical protein
MAGVWVGFEGSGVAGTPAFAMLRLISPRDYAQGDQARDKNNQERFEITAKEAK